MFIWSSLKTWYTNSISFRTHGRTGIKQRPCGAVRSVTCCCCINQSMDQFSSTGFVCLQSSQMAGPASFLLCPLNPRLVQNPPILRNTVWHRSQTLLLGYRLNICVYNCTKECSGRKLLHFPITVMYTIESVYPTYKYLCCLSSSVVSSSQL